MKLVVAVSAFALVLAGCGGGGGGGSSDNTPAVPEANAAQGLYSGTDANNNVIGGVVLDTGAFYFVYANTTTNAFGLVQGAASASHGTFQSDNARTFDITGKSATDTPVLAGYNEKNSIQGAVYTSAAKQASIRFNVVYDAAYERPISLSSVAGAYSGAAGSTKGNETTTFSIGQDGAIKGSGLSGCTFSGTATPHADKNYLDTTITFGAAPCLYPNAKVTGVTFFTGHEILAALTLPDRSDAFVVAATK
ncbi:hypothetical protein AWB77_06508 [Caballeronia fortuita]|uniref:Lipoprotein n=1 Tax=Caballeronia fortuita TaxID=1777138 RepID=A0A158E5Z0_9BURK|nr:hypothetical protein [Caballeronia fortuita]SAL02269.1 hypothetical protein AWB77_06508 [Caballeronia fortuita]